jgi:hypothetical protein
MVPDIAAKATIDAKVKRRKACPLFARPDRASLRRNARNKQGSGSVSFLSDYLRGQAAWHREYKERLRIEQRRWIEWRRREHVVDPALPGAAAIQRIAELSKTNRGSSITDVPSCAAGLRTYLASNKTKPSEHHYHVHPPR